MYNLYSEYGLDSVSQLISAVVFSREFILIWKNISGYKRFYFRVIDIFPVIIQSQIKAGLGSSNVLDFAYYALY